MLNIHASHISLIGGDNIMDTNELNTIISAKLGIALDVYPSDDSNKVA